MRSLKRDILFHIAKAFASGDFEENARKIPFVMRPKGFETNLRCCIHKERAVIRDRVLAGLGFSIEKDDEVTLLSAYAKDATERQKPDDEILTVLQGACKGCVQSSVYVTDMCQGCVARPCTTTCKFGAITIVNGKSQIDSSKCKNCGLCMASCPYGAIQKTIVPCESACPVGAIKKDISGHAIIDFDKCISCGKCIARCPFGAIHEKSQIVDILTKIKQGKKVVALLAPALAGQFPYPLSKLHTAFLKIGFSDVLEVAEGAAVTTLNEANEFYERLENGDKFMTTSCCAAYLELVKKHMPEIQPFVSDTKTPAFYTAEIAKKKYPKAVTVFVSPCCAKRKEGLDNPNIDYVLNFEELDSILKGMEIDVNALDPTEFETESTKEGRGFPILGGVSGAVSSALEQMGEDIEVSPCIINGLSKEAIKTLRNYAKCADCEKGNLIEVMSCEGGCVGGTSALNAQNSARKLIEDYAKGGGPVYKP